jgi:hypothetical protein
MPLESTLTVKPLFSSSASKRTDINKKTDKYSIFNAKKLYSTLLFASEVKS